ncbi:hypothetical protein PITC_006290 [Penicillium italicum]|uniref:Uncharacterized protein n=1 Tax=Penicillium italicum TaxID=40296 RepID=A0A0A2LA89_PENIT|nr:hypothetical protein PITC_006290 [Penicillium italicum]
MDEVKPHSTYFGNHTHFNLRCKPPFRKWLNCKCQT